jgi:pimeloyl-ACP methyl ester carboxylesterase
MSQIVLSDSADVPPAVTDTGHLIVEHPIEIAVGSVRLDGNLVVPEGAIGLVVFAHGSGSSRHSPRNRSVATVLHGGGLATLLFDLLTAAEEAIDVHTRHVRFDIRLLADRLTGAVDWTRRQPVTRDLPVGLFGASTGAAAALIAAAARPQVVRAVVSRGGRPDLAGPALASVQAPTLLIVGGSDAPVIDLNEQALEELSCAKALAIVPGATHLFEEPGTLEQVAAQARDWFVRYLSPDAPDS